MNTETTKHTPGPWKVKPESRFSVRTEDECACVADCYGTHSGEAEANAILIAAAPKLLEVLNEILHADNIDAESGGVSPQEWNALMLKASRIADKAKGKL